MKSSITWDSLNRCGFGRVDEACLKEPDKNIFLLRREAVKLKLEGQALKEIETYTGLKPQEVCRLVSRFTTLDDFGVYHGEIALLPNKRIKQYTRKNIEQSKRSEQQGSLSGILGLTIAKHPDAFRKFVKRVLQQGTTAFRGLKYKKSYYYAEFLNILREDGVTDAEWPFSVQGAGKRTILKLIDSILNQDFEKAVFAVADVGGKAHLQVGNGMQPLIVGSAPFDVIEIDAYKIDGFFSLAVRPETNLTTTTVINRFWLIAAVESRSEAVLAYRLVFSSEVRAQDILDLICDASAGGWKPISELDVPGLEYPNGAGMPCYLIEESRGALWGCLYLDNAMAQHAALVSSNARNILGFSINYGQLGRPERRSQIEGLFRQASQRFLHLIPSSTGSYPWNGRSEAPIENAEKYKINIDEASQVVDVFMAAYNITPRRGRNYSLSPVEVMRQFFRENGLIFPRLQDRLQSVSELSSHVKQCTVRGGIKKGIRPYIQLDKAHYTSAELASRPALIGERLRVKIDPKDYRTVDAYYTSGEFFGTLHVQGIWRHSKHSVTTRKIINRAIEKRVLECSMIDDVIVKYREHLISSKTRSTNLELQRLFDEQFGLEGDVEKEAPAIPAPVGKVKVHSVTGMIGFDLKPGQLIPRAEDDY